MVSQINSIVFHRSYQEAISLLDNDKDQLLIYKSIFNYAFEGIEPEFTGLLKIVWVLILPNLENSKTAVKEYNTAQEYGKLGGRPKKEKTPLKPPFETPLEKGVKNPLEKGVKNHDIDLDKDYDLDKDKDKDKEKDFDNKKNEEFFNKLKSSQMFLENVCLTHKIKTIDEALMMLDRFYNELKIKNMVKDNEQDFRSHFANWIKYQKKEMIKENNTVIKSPI